MSYKHDPKTCRGCLDPEGVKREQYALLAKDLAIAAPEVQEKPKFIRRYGGSNYWGRTKRQRRVNA